MAASRAGRVNIVSGAAVHLGKTKRGGCGDLIAYSAFRRISIEKAAHPWYDAEKYMRMVAGKRATPPG